MVTKIWFLPLPYLYFCSYVCQHFTSSQLMNRVPRNLILRSFIKLYGHINNFTKTGQQKLVLYIKTCMQSVIKSDFGRVWDNLQLRLPSGECPSQMILQHIQFGICLWWPHLPARQSPDTLRMQSLFTPFTFTSLTLLTAPRFFVLGPMSLGILTMTINLGKYQCPWNMDQRPYKWYQ
jgi:hypothetical protein